jgi:hypothetical protein
VLRNRIILLQYAPNRADAQAKFVRAFSGKGKRTLTSNCQHGKA